MSNSITGAISNVFATSDNAATLRTLTSPAVTMFADFTTSPMVRPFIVVGEGPTSLFGQTKNTPYAAEIRDVTISFYVYGRNRPEVESILDQLEAVYIDLGQGETAYTFDNYNYLGTWFADRATDFDKEGYKGLLSVIFQVNKN
jgi:hypothetical protein